MIMLSRQVALSSESIDVRKFFITDGSLAKYMPPNEHPEDLLNWVNSHIAYVPETVDFWSYPDETVARRNGDCEDGAILLANLLLQAGYPYYKILICVYGSHVVVEFDGKIFDWTGAGVPSGVPLWYCWNAKHAYTTKENANPWKN